MAKVQHNRATAAWILQIGFSRNTKSANKDGFHRDSQIYQKLHVEAHKQMIQTSRKSSYGGSHK